MSTKAVTLRTRSTYKFIRRNENQFAIEMMCRWLGGVRSGYYA